MSHSLFLPRELFEPLPQVRAASALVPSRAPLPEHEQVDLYLPIEPGAAWHAVTLPRGALLERATW